MDADTFQKIEKGCEALVKLAELCVNRAADLENELNTMKNGKKADERTL